MSWTRYIFNANNGAFVQSPIFFAYSSDGGRTFSAPQQISGNAHYSQGSRPVVGPDGTVYVFWDGATRLAALDSTYVAKSTDGGVTWSKPRAIAPLAEIDPLANAAFRVNSFPAADVAPDGSLYVAWSTQVRDSAAQNTYGDPASLCAAFQGCAAPHHSAAVYSKSGDGGLTWSSPLPILPGLDAQNRQPAGYDQLPAGTDLTPNTHRMDSLWPGVAVNGGRIYLSAYVADTVSPWQTCASGPPPPPGRIICDVPGPFVNNAKLNYYVSDLATGHAEVRVSGKAINTRYGFGAASSATTPAWQPAQTAASTPTGPIPTWRRTSTGSTAPTSTARWSASKTPSPRAAISNRRNTLVFTGWTAWSWTSSTCACSPGAGRAGCPSCANS